MLEVGSRDASAAIRSIVNQWEPASYTGVDLQAGPGVDIVAAAEDLLSCLGTERFDVVISTEMLEHVRDWKRVVHNLKMVLAPQGVLILTTRSRGMEFHGYPLDFWRFEVADMRRIFGDMDIEVLQADEEIPGVFLRARRPAAFVERELSACRLYSIVRRRPAARVTQLDVLGARFLATGKTITALLLPSSTRDRLRSWIAGAARRTQQPATHAMGDQP